MHWTKVDEIKYKFHYKGLFLLHLKGPGTESSMTILLLHSLTIMFCYFPIGFSLFLFSRCVFSRNLQSAMDSSTTVNAPSLSSATSVPTRSRCFNKNYFRSLNFSLFCRFQHATWRQDTSYTVISALDYVYVVTTGPKYSWSFQAPSDCARLQFVFYICFWLCRIRILLQALYGANRADLENVLIHWPTFLQVGLVTETFSNILHNKYLE